MSMTAAFLIDEIFSRSQTGMPSNKRQLTGRQFDAVRSLILDEDLYGTVRNAEDGSLVWTPAGGDKYILREDLKKWKHTLERLNPLTTTGSGMLF